MKHLKRSKETGRFIPKNIPNVVPGRLYSYKGVIVRAKRLCNNGLRFVTFHKTLNGFVPDSQLSTISREKVQEYLANQ